MTGEKGKFRQWHQKFANAMTQVNSEYGELIKRLEEELDTGANIEDAKTILETEFNTGDFARELHSILVDNSEG